MLRIINEGGNLMIEKLLKYDYDKIFDLMAASFPSDEYRTYDEQKALLDNPFYQVYVLKDSDNNSIKAFIAVWEFEDFAFIEHFTVNPEYRNGGIGAKILKEMVGLLGKTICLEVEPPEDELSARRIGFYQRNGFFLNPYPYVQPSISKGKNAISLIVMTSGRAVSEEEFESYKKVLYAKVYKCD